MTLFSLLVTDGSQVRTWQSGCLKHQRKREVSDGASSTVAVIPSGEQA